MATTTNIGLTKPAGTDKALVSVINSNSDIIDSAAGGLMDAIAIVANGNTHAAISAGQYVYVHNHGTLAEGLYTANSAIAANATLTTSNLTADASGGLNAINSNIANLITTDSFTTDSATIAAGDRGVFTKSITKTGYTALGIIQIALANNWLEIGSFTISYNNAQIVLHNKGGTAQTTTITFTVLYKKT